MANEEDERILLEKRRANVTAFDASPCLNATIDGMDLQKFKHYFLPKAMTDDEIEEDRKEGRTIKEQLSSFGFFDVKYDCPTNAGMLFFAKNLSRFIPGAYIQYVRFAGKDRAGDIMTEHEFCTLPLYISLLQSMMLWTVVEVVAFRFLFYIGLQFCLTTL